MRQQIMAGVKFLFLTACFVISTTEAARILAIFPYPSHSHQVVQHEVTIALAAKGHEITVFTTDPMNRNIPNYTEHSLNHLYNDIKKSFNFVEIQEKGLFFFFRKLYDLSGTIADETLSHPEMKKILSSKDRKDKFDLILLSLCNWSSLLYLSDLLHTPIIGITSLPGLAIHYHLMGSPFFSSYLPDTMLGYRDDMTLLQRIHNLYYNVRQIYEYYEINMPIQQKILRKHFGQDVPPIKDLQDRLSMLFINTHPHLNYARPMVPGILQIGGLRFGRMNKTLPVNLKKLLDNSTQGFIYFSLGSNVKSIQLRENTLNSFIEAFAELPYQVIWKFEADELERKPANVHIEKWIPQQGVLAHPNLKLFVYQGGAQSSEEAIENGVPMLGCPFFSDQWYNLNILMSKGVAKTLDIDSIDKDKIKNAIIEMISNSSYRENTIKLASLLTDRPQSALEDAIWWIEHVIRHKGAAHLRTRSVYLPWYKVELLDVFSFIMGAFIVLFLLGWTLLRLAIFLIKVLAASFVRKIKSNSLTMKKYKAS